MEKVGIIGVDEVGRGCLAGDLIVCAYTLRAGCSHEDLLCLGLVAMDSKAFSVRVRRMSAAVLVEHCGDFEFARRSPAQIDASNIRLATLDAMREAAMALRFRRPGLFETICDGKDLPEGMEQPARAQIKGDVSILEISCASILAKVMRDKEMSRLAEVYPGYGFERHAGYGTRQHREAISRQGLCGIHRSWARKFLP